MDSVDELRSSHRANRAALNSATQTDNAAALLQQIIKRTEYQSARHVAAYIAIRGEINLSALIDAGVAGGKQFYLPVLRGDLMHFVPWSPDQPLQKKGFGLLEPSTPVSEAVDPRDLDLVLAPLVVFDPRCNRIGQGGGYYDRTFVHKKQSPAEGPTLMGVAHDSQCEPQLQPQSWDVPLDLVITNGGVYSP